MSNEAQRSEFGELGLGATVPHIANLSINSGGGYSTQSTGGGVPSGETSVGGTIGSTFRPGGRTTSPEIRGSVGSKGGSIGRSTFQATGQGARISMGKSGVPTALKGRAGSHVSQFPVGGLFAL